MSGFNPNANGVLGVEWPVTVESAYAVDSSTKAAGAAVLSSAADTVDKASMYVAGVADSAVYVMEVWPLATLTESPVVSTLTARPNEDVVASNLRVRSAPGYGSSVDATVGTSYSAIDEATLDTSNGVYYAPDPSYYYAFGDYLRTRGAGDGAPNVYVGEWAGRVNVGVGNLAGKQILRVEMHAQVVAWYHWVAPFTQYLNIGGVKYSGTPEQVTDALTEVITGWDYNPATNMPWSIADIELFDVSDEIGFVANGTAFNTTYVHQVWMEVTYVTEQRLALGTATISATGWNEFNLSAPTGATNFSKGNGTEYLFTVRRLSGTGSASFRYLDSTKDPPNGNHGYAVQFESPAGRLLEAGAEYTRAHALVITTTAPATSVDSQPYALRSLADVYTGHTVESEFLGVAANYGVVKAVIAAQALAPSADLSVKVKRRSDNVQMGTTMTLTAAELTGAPTAPRQVTLAMAAVALAAVQYYVEFSTTAANGEGWTAVVLDTTGTGSTATYGSTTQAATVGGVEDTDTDAAFIIAQIPTAPATLIVAVNTAEVGVTGGDCPPPPATHDYAHLTWTQTALGANFDHYELERNDDGTWRQIAEITTEATVAFDDYEAMRGVLASYRLRVVHINTVASSYTATVTATSAADPGYVALVSNENPALNVVYQDETPRGYQFLDHPVIFDLYDRDGAASFRALERRGDAFTLRLIIGGADDILPPAVGRQAFQPLLDLINAQASYVCVLDSDGNRWFAACDVIDGQRSEPGGLYMATLSARWLTDTPSTPDAP